MITAHEALFRGRKGRSAMARVYRQFRKKHGWQAVGSLWKEVRELQRRAYAPGGDAFKARKPRLDGLQTLLS